MGTLKPGDHVVDVRKLEAVQSGSRRFTLSSKVFPVVIEYIRDVLSEPEFVQERGPHRSERHSESFSSSSAPADTHRETSPAVRARRCGHLVSKIKRTGW